jgi:hypothetical protein
VLLALWRQAAGPDGLGGKYAEQVEVGGLLIVENPHFVPGPGGGIEDFKPVRGLDQAHGTIDLFAQRVSGGRYGREAGKFGEDTLRGLVPERGAPTPGGRARAFRPG